MICRKLNFSLLWTAQVCSFQSTICTCICNVDNAHNPLLRCSHLWCTTPGCALKANKPQIWVHVLLLNALLSLRGKPKYRDKQVAEIDTMSHGRGYGEQFLIDIHCKKLFAKCLKYLYIFMVYINKNMCYWLYWDGFMFQRCRKRKK